MTLPAVPFARPVAPDPAGRAPGRTRFALSVDTGGTFTDGFVTGPAGSAQVKVDTTPADPTEGFAACVAAAAAAMGEPLASFLASTEVVHFSSTIATNIVVERSGAKVGLVVTAGHEDDLYGSGDQAGALGAYLAPGAVRGVAVGGDARVDGTGLETAVRELLEGGVAVVVISLAGAHLDPAAEVAAREAIEVSYPRHYLGSIPLVVSSQLSLEPDDHGRTALAVANAYLHPALARSLYRAEDRLRAQHFRRPLLVVNTDGSSTRVAKTRAIDTFNSGPSAGVLGAAIVARALDADHVVTFDVGGTTTDVAYIDGGAAPQVPVTALGALRVPHPSVALWSFGLGGGSVIEPGGTGIAVGPTSAGAVPGPACFGLGGTALTPTDVWLLLGYLEPGSFLSARRQLDPERAAAALDRFAGCLDATAGDAALVALAALHEALGREMTSWATGHPGLGATGASERWLLSYGGGGGLLATTAAEALDIGTVVVFPHSSVFSAFGGGLLPVAHSAHAPLGDVGDAVSVARVLTGLLDRAVRDLRAEGVAPADATVTVTVGTLSGPPATRTVPLSEALDGAAPPHPPGGSGPGRVSVAVRAERTADLAVTGDAATPPPGSVRRVRTAGGTLEVPVLPGLGRPGAAPVVGPAFLAATDTTVWVPPGWVATFDRHGYGLLRRDGGHD